jgi:hypothetical protein
MNKLHGFFTSFDQPASARILGGAHLCSPQSERGVRRELEREHDLLYPKQDILIPGGSSNVKTVADALASTNPNDLAQALEALEFLSLQLTPRALKWNDDSTN